MKRDLTERIDTVLIESKAVKGYARLLKKPLDALFHEGPLRPIKNVLNGRWLEHPLHPVLTDIPIGAWTLAVVLDLLALIFRVPNLGFAAGIAIGVGIVGALATIVTGLLDWMDVDPPELAIGVIHGTVNIIATLLFAVSFFMRMGEGWEIEADLTIIAVVAYLLLMFGGFLGGTLVFRLGVMVNRNAWRKTPSRFTDAVSLDQLPENKPTCVTVEGERVLLFRRGDQVTAIGAVCSHYGGPLEEGKVKDGNIECPWHYSQFSLRDGSVKSGPTTAPVPAYETRVNNGQVQVKIQKK